MLPKGKKVNVVKLRDRRERALDLLRMHLKKNPEGLKAAIPQVASVLRVSTTSVRRWWKERDTAHKIGRLGRRRKLDQEQRGLLREKLHRGPGPNKRWTGESVRQLIYSEFGVKVSYPYAAKMWRRLDPNHPNRRNWRERARKAAAKK
jgi:transposase